MLHSASCFTACSHTLHVCVVHGHISVCVCVSLCSINVAIVGLIYFSTDLLSFKCCYFVIKASTDALGGGLCMCIYQYKCVSLYWVCIHVCVVHAKRMCNVCELVHLWLLRFSNECHSLHMLLVFWFLPMMSLLLLLLHLIFTIFLFLLLSSSCSLLLLGAQAS